MNILFVDDEINLRQILGKELKRLGHEVAVAADGAEAMAALEAQSFDAAIFDINLPDMTGVELLRQARQRDPQLEVMMLTGQGSIESAVECMKIGAADYLTKPCKLAEIAVRLERLEAARRLKLENACLRGALERNAAASPLVGETPPVVALRELISRVAPTAATILICGETGSGKELVAHEIHRQSLLKDQPLHLIDCAAIESTVLASELFGHAKGAFTGAADKRVGLIEAADGGSVFLDEISEMSPDMQARFLRLLDTGEYRRVGDNQIRRAQVRFLAASNRDLAAAVRAGSFREDLYHRLKVVTVNIPPLRERLADIPLLAAHFLRHKRLPEPRPDGFSEAAIAAMARYSWPGNVRELANVVERAAILCRNSQIDIFDLPAEIAASDTDAGNSADGLKNTVNNAERDAIIAAIKAARGNKTAAARNLGISVRALYNKLEALNIPLST